MKTLILRHALIEHAGVFENVFESKNINFTYVDPNQEIPKDNYDMLMVLGGYMGVYEVNDYPFLTKEFRTIEYFLKENKPVIGVCLGAQMLAYVLGAPVYKGSKGREIGWCDIEKIEYDTFFKDFPKTLKVFQWHQDTFDVPKNSKLIYTSDRYPQAFVYKKAVGLQFHIELNQDMIKEWSKAYEEDLKQENIKEQELLQKDYTDITSALSYKLIENIL